MSPIKRIFNPLVKWIATNSITWKITTYFSRAGEWIRYERSKFEQLQAEKKLLAFFEDKIVRNGFFRGMKYVTFKSAGSSLFPKLLGSYEIELLPVFAGLQKNKYHDILDIGCAEGYYAVGLALKFPGSKVYGYDIDKEALRLCTSLAIHNQVGDRVFLYEKCTASTLETFKYSDRTLIVCDCEGYERELFTEANISKLKSADLIIELHPFAAKDVQQYLVDLLSETHELNIISSHDNNRKIFDFKFLLPDMNQTQLLKSVEEGRPFTMDWLIAESKLVKYK